MPFAIALDILFGWKKRNIKKQKFIKNIKMGKNYFVISKLKNKFYSSQSPIFFLEDIVIYKVLLFNKISLGEKNYKYLAVCISACCLFV